MTDEEIRSLPIETLREALYEHALHDIGIEFFNIHFLIKRAGKTLPMLAEELQAIERHIEDAKALDPHPRLSYDNLWFVRNVVEQLRKNPAVRDNPDLAKWGLFSAASCCFSAMMITGETLRRWGSRLKMRGLNISCFFTINRKD